ncbi:MAG: hypothetical protein HXN81_07675 [Prevotella pallens]|uniref:hypothetical protein n=1 Tax=Prevotella pallens TaxID=60133 RepID=UPI001CB59961|nr:hypothetical protein [Prevotella pallens]MBF1498650.1 hypothetical protein [Prevotella pallens]
MRIWLWEYAYLVMLGHGHDESDPYAWRNVCNQFRGCAPPFTECFVGVSWCVRGFFTVCSLHYCNSCDTLL